MARLNVSEKTPHVAVTTHESAPAYRHMTAEQALRRSVMSCLLWEGEFYEDGQAIADRISALADEVPVATLASIAFEARSKFNVRHVPLLLLTALARRGAGSSLVSDTIAATIQRADELSEFLTIYAKANGVPANKLKNKLSAQVKKGLAAAFTNFDEYQLAKYDREGSVRLRDALFLCHANPKDEAMAAMWKRLVADKLVIPDTWEVALSGGADKRETFTRLLTDQKLGYLALLRNLRNMADAGVDPDLVRQAIIARRGAQRVLPFRYVAAARAAKQFEPAIDQALSEAISYMPALTGKTVVLVDVSGSMKDAISAKSDLTRMDAAAALASIIHGDLRVFSFSDSTVEVPPRRGMAGVDAIIRSQPHTGTDLGGAVKYIYDKVPFDRLIVITDEQSATKVSDPPNDRIGYMINVASNRNGVGYGKWVHIDGFSEAVIAFIHEYERGRAA